MVQDDADVMNKETMDKDRRYCGAVGTYDTEGQPFQQEVVL